MSSTCENPEIIEISELTIPDGSTNPMTPDDLKIVRKMRPDLDEKLAYAQIADDDD